MATTNLSSYNPDNVPDARGMHFGIVVSDWNREVTWVLLEGAISTLKKHGAIEKNIIVKHVPGSFELRSELSSWLNTVIWMPLSASVV